MKLLKKLFISLFLIFIIYLVNMTVYAASVSISTSKSTVKPGESFTVTVSANNGAGYVSASSSNGSGGLGKTWLDNSSASFTCKAGSSGTVTISASGVLADYGTAKDQNVSNSKTVKIQENKPTPAKITTKKTTTPAKPKKTDNNEKKEEEKLKEKIEEVTKYLLNKLEINGYKLTPEFNSEVYEYEIKTVETEKLDISTEANTDKAIIDIIGNENLKIGENEITIKLKGQEDKDITTYKIKVLNKKSELTIANEKIQNLEAKTSLLTKIIISLSIAIFVLIILLAISCKKKCVRGK